MIAIHDQFTHQMRNRLKTTCMGLGLVRLLQNARRFEEARATLALLENGCHEVEKPSQKLCPVSELTGVTRTAARLAGSTGMTSGEALTRPLSLA